MRLAGVEIQHKDLRYNKLSRINVGCSICHVEKPKQIDWSTKINPPLGVAGDT